MLTAVIRAVVAVLVVIGSFFLVGCQTLDPAGEIASASIMVAERSGHGLAIGSGCLPLPPGPLAVGDAVRLALANNPAIQADLATIAAARADLVQATLPPNPMVNSSIIFGDGASMLAVGTMQTLSALWLIPSRTRAADAELQQAVLRVSDNSLNLAANVEQTHRRVAYLQQLVDLLGQQEQIVVESVQAARRKMDAGLATIVDVNRLSVELYSVQAGRRTARRDLANEKLALLELIGLADSMVEWSASTPNVMATTMPDEQELIAAARSQRLDLLAAGWAIQARMEGVGEARLSGLPELGVGTMAQRESDEMTRTMIGPAVSASVPVFDWGQARTARAGAELEQVRARAAALDQQAVREVRVAHQAVLIAGEQVRAYQQDILPLARRNVADIQEAFDADAADVIDVLMAQRTLLASLVEQARFSMELDVAHSRLARAVGGLASHPAPVVRRGNLPPVD